MLIDFHTHTTASDGALSPTQLVQRALQRDVALLAITDHDTMEGYRAVRELRAPAGESMRLISGIEFSCCWSGATIHIVGLGVDSQDSHLTGALDIMDRARLDRANTIARRLAERGFEGALPGAIAKAGESQLGRPHFAAWMADRGHVQDEREAFERFLGRGKIGDVKTYWPEMAVVVQWITAAQGIAVLAHPHKYKFTGMKLRRLIEAFVQAGGTAIELLSGRQTADQTSQLQRLAQDYALEISIGSDFHRDFAYGAPLGVELPRCGELPGVWQRWL